MELDSKRLYAWLLVLTSLLRVRGDVESTLARCCVLGANWAREEEACALFPTPVQGEPSEHQSICLTSAAICCLRLYREQQCEAGKAAAQRGQDCRLPAAEGGEYYKDCCEGCKLGLVSGSMALSCSFRSLQFGFPWDAAYIHCCSQLHPELPVPPRPGVEDDTRDNSVLYPGSQTIADSENLCLLFPGQLCAHVCVPVPGSYSCQCRAGFTLSLDKKTCLQDKQGDRCSENDACEHICRDTGVAIECACDPGYRLASDQRTCLDIDECTAGLHSCMPGEQVCYNQDGTYACVNPDGSLTSPWVAPLNTPAPRGPASRGPIGVGHVSGGSDVVVGGALTTDRTEYIVGSPGRCPTGYRYNTRSRVCDDIDECLTVQNLCGRGGLCTNTIGSYTCTQLPRDTCPPGYLFDLPLQSCLDIDECAADQDNCDHAEQFCINTQGGFVCQPRQDTPGACPAGYKYNEDNSACEDVNECEERRDSCTSSQTCINSVGSYRCIDRSPTCPFGYRHDPATRECLDINECREGRDFCDALTERCTNLPGGYRCKPLAVPIRGPPSTAPLPNNASEPHADEANKLPSHLVPPSPPPLPPRPDLVEESSSSTADTNPTTSSVSETQMEESEALSSKSPGNAATKTSTASVTTSLEPTIALLLKNTPTLPSIMPPTSSTFSRCPPGFKYDQLIRTCKDENECQASPCAAEERCRNTLGSFECHCREGYREDSNTGRCKDINECQLGNYDCDTSQRCDNTIGSYTCVRISGCGTGYTLNHNNGLCEDDDECDSGKHDCDQLGPQWVCVNTKGSFRCEKKTCPDLQYLDPLGECVNVTCPQGYTPFKKTCVDIDECSTSGPSPCRPNENCVNLQGSHTCQPKVLCSRGFRMNDAGDNCVDIDECVTGAHECSGGQECNNRQGTYTCQCPPGYRLDRARQCQDIDECTSFYGAACSSNAACQNTPGSFLCNCHEGFTKTEEGGRNCIDVDECSVDPNVCHHRCINIRGGFQCICNAGYNLSPDNRTCVDVDECEETRDRRGGRLCVGVCENTHGSFQCSCPSGYTLSPDQRTCKDSNECDRPGLCRNAKEQCINTRGGHRCMEIMCPQDYIRDTTHKSRCKKKSLFCRKGDLECAQQPLSYSYNFLPLVSNMSLPNTGQVDLFTMRGPLWSTATVHFALDMETTRAPSGIAPATRDFFRLRRTSVNQAVISLVTRLEGPQEVQLALSMKLYHENVYSGSAVAKLLILVSEYDF